MPSESTPDVYVWVWLPGATAPVVAGVLTTSGPTTNFTYGTSYQRRPDAIPLYLPELPVQSGPVRRDPGLRRRFRKFPTLDQRNSPPECCSGMLLRLLRVW